MKGRILDASTQEGLPAASVRVLGGSQGEPALATEIATEIDGTYTLTLVASTYTLVVSTPEYVEQRRTLTVAPRRPSRSR